MYSHFVVPLVDAPGSQGGSCYERAGCRPPLGPILAPQGLGAWVGVHKEECRAEPRVVDGICAQVKEQHPLDLLKQVDIEVLLFSQSSSDISQMREFKEGIHKVWIPPTSCGVGGVGIAILQFCRPQWHQRRRGGVLRVGHWVAQHHWLPDLSTLNTSLLLPLFGHITLQLLEERAAISKFHDTNIMYLYGLKVCVAYYSLLPSYTSLQHLNCTHAFIMQLEHICNKIISTCPICSYIVSLYFK